MNERMEMAYHVPALLKETVDGLNINPDGVYVDVTFGGGGHSKEILRRLSENGKLVAFDQDEDVLQNVFDDVRLIFVRSNFCFLKNFLRYHHIEKVDGVLADLGVSFHHFDVAERGFSFRFDGSLDMRMNQKSNKTAAMILNTYDEEALSNIFFFYGELRNARKIAKRIVQMRSRTPFLTIKSFVDAIQPLFYKEKEKKDIVRLFQALRIEVNNEMETLKDMLMQSAEMLREGGRLSVLTYHSLEDRLVKNFMKSGNFEGDVEKDFYGNVLAPMKMINGKAFMASEEEVERNPRSRSAKLRVAERL